MFECKIVSKEMKQILQCEIDKEDVIKSYHTIGFVRISDLDMNSIKIIVSKEEFDKHEVGQILELTPKTDTINKIGFRYVLPT